MLLCIAPRDRKSWIRKAIGAAKVLPSPKVSNNFVPRRKYPFYPLKMDLLLY